jgi:hypothetical protein
LEGLQFEANLDQRLRDLMSTHKLSMVEHICILATMEAQVGGSWSVGQHQEKSEKKTKIKK